MMNLIACAAYVTTAAICLAACIAARNARRSRAEAHIWAGIAGICALQTVSRGCGLEEAARQALRAILRQEALYENRANIQISAAILLVLLLIAAIWALARQPRGWRRFGRANLAKLALFAAVSWLVLVALRIGSFHGTDQLLFTGAIRLNWVLDAAITGTILLSAARYLSLTVYSPSSRQKPRDRPR